MIDSLDEELSDAVQYYWETRSGQGKAQRNSECIEVVWTPVRSHRHIRLEVPVCVWAEIEYWLCAVVYNASNWSIVAFVQSPSTVKRSSEPN